MLKCVRIVPLFLLLFLSVAPSAYGVGRATILSYADGALGGYTQTWLEFGEGEEYFCEHYNALLDHCYWWGRVVPWVSQWGRLYDPYDGLVYAASDWDFEDSQVNYNESGPVAGTWTAEGEHYLGWDYYREYCGYYDGCYGEQFIGPDWEQLDDSTDSAYVPSLDVTEVYWSPDFFIAPGCTALNVDSTIDAFEFYYSHNNGSPAYVEYWGNGDQSCVGEQQSGQFGVYVVTAVRNLAGGVWFYPQQANPTQAAMVTIQEPPYLHVTGSPAGSCGQVIRGQALDAELVNTAGLSNFSWSFAAADGSGINGQNLGGTSWSGLVVVSGTIRVDFTGGAGFATCAVTVVNRNWWHVSQPPLLNPTNGAPNGTYEALPTPPVPNGELANTGMSHNDVPVGGSFNEGPIGIDSFYTLTNGPNTGYVFFLEPPRSESDYQINPDLLNSNSTFSLRQCGQFGYLSWQTLLSETRRHEYNHPTASHYGQFNAALSTGVGGANPGTFLEAQVWGPNGASSYNDWFSSTTQIMLTKRAVILSFTRSHANIPAVNYNAAGTPLGNIHYPPYPQAGC